MEALTEYAYRARLRDITDMSVVVEASASNMGDPVRISSDTLATVHRMDVGYDSFPFWSKHIKYNTWSFRFLASGATSTSSAVEPVRPFCSSKSNTASTGMS